MNKRALVFVVVMVLAAGYWFLSNQEVSGPVSPELNERAPEVQDVENVTGEIVRTPSSPDREVYINQVWRFSFEIPKGTTVRDPEAGSAVALVNLGILPEGEGGISPVRVFLSPKSWVDRLLDKKEGDIQIGGLDGWYYQSVTMSVIPKMSYFVLVNDEYWVNIGIQNEYLEDFQMVLDTFEFHNPPTLEELGIDPENPPGVKNGVSSQQL